MAIPTAGQRPVPDFLDTGFLKLVAVALLLLGAIFGLMQPASSIELGRAGAIVFWMLHAVAVVVLQSWGFPGLWLEEFGGLAPPFVLAWVLINLPRLTRLGTSTSMPPTGPAPRSPAESETEPAVPEEPPREMPEPQVFGPSGGLLDQLPEALGTDVVLLTSDLHYLHFHTPRGRTMLLYNLSDAESELVGKGIRVHRSHWVADLHVRGLRRKGSTLVCQLTGDLEVPVSRRRQAEVVARYGRDTRYRSPG